MTLLSQKTATHSEISSPFLSFADQGMFLAHSAAGQHAVIQVLWRYRHPVDFDALKQFRDNLAYGRLGRLVKQARLPFARHHWIKAPPPVSDLTVAETPISKSLLQTWADTQIRLPLDPEHGPAWTFSVQPLSDGSTVVSLVVSHCIADGVATTLAVKDAVHGERRPAPESNTPSTSVKPTAVSLATELLRFAQDIPATARAVFNLTQIMRPAFVKKTVPRALPNVPTTDDRTVIFPSVFLRVPLSSWDEKARNLGANRLTLITAITADFAKALGRVLNQNVSVLIPVNQRNTNSNNDGNCVSLARFTIAVDEARENLNGLKKRLHSTLMHARRDPDKLGILLPLVPFIPKRLFARAGQLALGAFTDLPITCSNLGELPEDVLKIDGTSAEDICCRGVDRPLTLSAIEARGGVATLFAGVIPGFLALSFVAYQPGVVTETHQLHQLVKQVLKRYELTGEYFDD